MMTLSNVVEALAAVIAVMFIVDCVTKQKK